MPCILALWFKMKMDGPREMAKIQPVTNHQTIAMNGTFNYHTVCYLWMMQKAASVGVYACLRH